MAQTSRRPAGWTSAIWPDDIGGLAEYVGERLTLFREFMDRNPAYWMREQVSSSFIRRKPNPRIVRARIGLAVDCLNQARRWVDSRKLNGVPDLCTPASEAEAEESLSRLYRSLRVIAAESEPKPPSLAGNQRSKSAPNSAPKRRMIFQRCMSHPTPIIRAVAVACNMATANQKHCEVCRETMASGRKEPVTAKQAKSMLQTMRKYEKRG